MPELKKTELLYSILDIFFVLFHSALIVFNVTGWIWKKTRFASLVTLLLTGFSWLFIGMIVGIPGYCPLTDWHFRILEEMGRTGLPSSYIKYLADRLTGQDFNPLFIDRMTLYVFAGALLLSLFLNIRDLCRKRMK